MKVVGARYDSVILVNVAQPQCGIAGVFLPLVWEEITQNIL